MTDYLKKVLVNTDCPRIDLYQ